MLQLSDLPSCLLLEILSYLPICDVIRIRLVCKLWHETSSFVRFQSLSLYRVDIEGEWEIAEPKEASDTFLITRRQFTKKFDLHLNDFQNFLKCTGPMIRGLQRLVVHVSADPINLADNRLQNFLNGFRRLEELELEVRDFDFHPPDFVGHPRLTLELPRLRMLYSKYGCELLELDCPQLSYLDVERFANCRFRYPESVRTIVADVPTENQLRKFVNLKNLVIYLRLVDLSQIPRTFFQRLPNKLQRLIIFKHPLFRDTHSNGRELQEHLRASYTIDTEEPRLRVFYFGIEISLHRLTNEDEPLPPYFNGACSRFLITNLASMVDGNISRYWLEYDWLESQLSSFDLFYQKNDLKYQSAFLLTLTGGNAVDPDRLYEFLQKVQPAPVFENTAAFPRPLFDRLIEICSPFLQVFHLEAGHFSREPGALDFLWKMPKLKWLDITNGDAFTMVEVLDLAITAHEKIKTLREFWFKSESFSGIVVNWSALNTGYFSVRYPNEEVNQIDRSSVEASNIFDLLRYMSARLKQSHTKRPPNQLKDLLEVIFMTDELEQQEWFVQFAFERILDYYYIEAIPIYMWPFPRLQA